MLNIREQARWPFPTRDVRIALMVEFICKLREVMHELHVPADSRDEIIDTLVRKLENEKDSSSIF
jgi:hypothetical protein